MKKQYIVGRKNHVCIRHFTLVHVFLSSTDLSIFRAKIAAISIPETPTPLALATIGNGNNPAPLKIADILNGWSLMKTRMKS